MVPDVDEINSIIKCNKILTNMFTRVFVWITSAVYNMGQNKS